MAFRTRREARYLKLRQHGFLRFEARALSKVSTRVCPYLRNMMKERLGLMRESQKLGRTLRQYEDSIKELYQTNKWLTRNRVGRIVADPWRMFREQEDKFKAKFPQYTSPWQKRWRDWRQFQAKIEKTMRRQEGAA